MAGEQQERFEDYVELEAFLANLQAGQADHPPSTLTPTQARVYRMALLFHAATPGVIDLRPAFAAQLWSQLVREYEEQHPSWRSYPPVSPPAGPKRRVSRRWLFTGSALAAASAAIGAGLERLIEQASQAGTSNEWSLVTTVADLHTQAVRFTTEHLTGYVVRSDDTPEAPPKPGQILALSAACTHLGCLVLWSGADRTFHCPCHGAVFTADGRARASTSSRHTLPPLPQLDVKIEAGNIYVRIPL